MKADTRYRHWIEALEPREFMSVSQVAVNDADFDIDSSSSATAPAEGSPVFAELHQIQRGVRKCEAASPPDPDDVDAAFALLEARLAQIQGSRFGLPGNSSNECF